jgi:hypothetical protein
MAASNRGSALGNQVTFQELSHHEPHALVHDQLGHDQQRQRDQKADMHFHVPQERDGDVPTQRLAFQRREYQERQPGQQRDEEDAAVQEIQSSPGQMRPPQQLEERPAQDEREVPWLLEHICMAG